MAVARSVAIVGGGIGGLTAANALTRLGMNVSLYERSPYFTPTSGAAFGLQPNGQLSLTYIDLEDEVNKIIHPFRKWQIINDHGGVIATSDRLEAYGKRFGYYLGGAIRSELIDMLKEPIEKKGNMHYSHHVISVQQQADGVTLVYKNGNQHGQARADIVIGADGIRSTVAKQVFGETALPVYSRENIFFGMINNIDHQMSIVSSIAAKNTITQYFGRGEFICYRAGNQGQFMWAATYPSESPPLVTADTEWTEMNNQRDLDRLLSRFPPSHPVHQCAAATAKERLLHFGLYYRQHRSDGWHRNRVCLLGDSCHATLPYVGQGANMAIEDAMSLAMCLEKHNFQIEPTFQEYYRKRFNRTKRVVNMARYMGLFFHSENSIVHAIRQRLVPWLIKSDMVFKMAEKEIFENCPVPLNRQSHSK